MAEPCPFTDCIYHARCEHQEPNLCGVAVPDHLDENGEYEWCYPVAECPTAGAPGPAKLRWTDIDRSLLARFLTPECSTCRRWSFVNGCGCRPGGVECESEQCTECAERRREDL